MNNITKIKLGLLKNNTGQIEGVPANPRYIKDAEFEKLKTSILVFPQMLFLRPITYAGDYVTLGGNQRRGALADIAKLTIKQIEKILNANSDYLDNPPEDKAETLQFWKEFLKLQIIPAQDASHLSTYKMREFVIKDNISFGEDDFNILQAEWGVEKFIAWGGTMPENWGVPAPEPEQPKGKLSDVFIVPPFTVLDAKKGYWQARKKEWKALIQDKGETRKGVLGANALMGEINDGTSILDPVLAEIANRWFLPAREGNKTFDCFAGDTVFGFVSAHLGNEFTGIELRKEQAEVNNKRVEGMSAKYINDDGQNVAQHIEPESQDLLFSCPPYYDLEVYSDLPNDASNQGEYRDFLQILENAFAGAIKCLKNNRFAYIVVGDIRNKKTGFYYRFPDHIKEIFERHGMPLYNEMILADVYGTLPRRVGRYMQARKIGKAHQNVLVFFKGSTAAIKENFHPLTKAEQENWGIEDEELETTINTAEEDGGENE